MKKALGETQTLRAGCSKAEPNIFAPPQTPFPGARDGQNLINWRWSLPSPTDPVWWRSMHTIRGNRPTNTHTDTHTHTHTYIYIYTDRGDYNTLRCSLARSVMSDWLIDLLVTQASRCCGWTGRRVTRGRFCISWGTACACWGRGDCGCGERRPVSRSPGSTTSSASTVSLVMTITNTTSIGNSITSVIIVSLYAK